MLKTYRFTYRMETFVQAPDSEAAQRAFEAGDEKPSPLTVYVEQVSGPERYCSPFGSPVEGGDDE